MAAALGAYTSGGSTGSSTIVLPSVTTQASGSRFFVYCVSTSVTGVTDNKGNTYTKLLSTASTFKQYDVWMATGTGGSGHVVTVNCSSASDRFANFVEVTNASTLDVNQVSLTTNSPWTTTSPTLAEADEYALYAIANASTSTTGVISESTGFTDLGGTNDGVLYWVTKVFGKALSSTTAISPSSTDTTFSGTGDQILLTIKSAAAAPTPSDKLGWWDGELRSDAWWDAELQPAGWWDTEIINPATGGGSPQALTPSLVTNTSTIFAPTVTQPAGTQTLTPGLLTNTSSIFAPTVTVGSVALAPTLLTNTPTLFAPTVTRGAVTLTPSLLTNSSTIFAATLAPGAVSLTPTLVSNTSTLFAPTVTQGGGATQTLTPSLLTNTSTIFASTVSTGAVTLTPGLLTNSSTLFAPTVAAGAVTLAPALLTNASTIYAPTVALAGGAGQTLTPGLLTNSSTVFTPLVVAGSVTLAPPLLTNTTQLFAPSVTLQNQSLGIPFIDSTSMVFAPQVNDGTGSQPGGSGGKVIGSPWQWVPFNPVKARRPKRVRDEELVLM